MAPTNEENDAGPLAVERILANAWDTTETKQLNSFAQRASRLVQLQS
jgi:hypothetical protein